jgi:hypothetical protein
MAATIAGDSGAAGGVAPSAAAWAAAIAWAGADP